MDIPFRQRAHEVTRLEAFSDIVFGFALTLIVVALEVPDTFEELMHDLRGVGGFAICFAILIWIWHAHHTFFRRYGLKDDFTLVINSVLLFLVLVYVYPLKFMFAGMTGALGRHIQSASQARTLFTIYGLGFAGVFLLFVVLYVHAWWKRDELELNAVELHDTFTGMWMYGSYVLVGLFSTAIAWIASGWFIGLAGFSYFLLGPVSAIVGFMRGSRRGKVAAAMAATATA